MRDPLWRKERRFQTSNPFLLPVLAVLLSLAGSSYAFPQATKPPSVPAQGATATPANAQFVGSDTCKGCHEDIYTKHFEGTPHFSLTKTGKHGCEDCHGPGSAHVEGAGDISKIISFKALKTDESSKICLKCHSASKEHTNFLRSVHLTNNVGCTTCHSPHHANIARSLLKDSQPQLCYGCHTVQRAEFARPFRHRVNERLILCSDCHNVHGSELPHQLRTSATQDQVCFNCHTDTKGPFVFEHLPVKTEGCVACHTPHGSSNPRLLRRSNVNLLCLECHTLTVDSAAPAIPSFHNQAQKYQACTMCHVAIHGSNSDHFFFKP